MWGVGVPKVLCTHVTPIISRRMHDVGHRLYVWGGEGQGAVSNAVDQIVVVRDVGSVCVCIV